MKRALATMVVAVLGCEPAPCEQQWGYYFGEDAYPAYSFEQTHESGSGVRIDASGQPVDLEKVDRYVAEVEACTGPIDRDSFRLKVAGDWVPSCDGSEELLPMPLPDRTCKGKDATEGCPCRYRAIVQCPDLVVATPNLKLFKDALIRLETGSQNPWVGSLAACASPDP